MGAELGKKIDSLGEVLLLKNLPENERKAVCNNIPKSPEPHPGQKKEDNTIHRDWSHSSASAADRRAAELPHAGARGAGAGGAEAQAAGRD
jgi:hypothetical protein